MHLTSLLLPLLAASSATASITGDLAEWSVGLVQGGAAPKTKGEVHTYDSWSYVDCGLPSDVVQLKSLKVSPDPPQPGKELTVEVEAEVKETIDDGAYADVLVKLGLIKLLQKRFDVCEEAANANATVQCPVKPGTYNVKQSVDLPKEIPHAKFQVQVRAFNFDEKDMLCADIFIDFVWYAEHAEAAKPDL